MSRRLCHSSIVSAATLVWMAGAAFAASPAEQTWKRVKAADSPIAYARFLEAHPDFDHVADLRKRLAAANRRAAASGRQRDLAITWSRAAEPQPEAPDRFSYMATIAGVEGARRIRLDLVFGGGSSASPAALAMVPGVAKEKGKGSWATFLAETDTTLATTATPERTEPVLAIVRGPGRSLPPVEIYVAGSPVLRLVAASGAATESRAMKDQGSAASSFRLDEPPVSIKVFTPDYPDEARQGKIEGLVLVEVTVGVTGRVVDAKVVRSDTIPALEEAALRAALLSIFRPALQDGVPVEARVVLPFRFKRN